MSRDADRERMGGNVRAQFRLAVAAVMATAAAVLSLYALTATASAQAPARISIAVIGDTAYAPEREPQLEALLADMGKAPLAFAVHVGDLGNPRTGSCTDGLWQKRLAQFNALPYALVYTPGDNEWTDCHAAFNVTDLTPPERLGALRRLFFPTERSLGLKPLALLRQSAGGGPFAAYRENARWDMAGVTFLTVHVVGSNNNRGRTPETTVEYEERTAADLAWLAAGFAHAKAAGSRAVMVFQQANMFPGLTPFYDEGKGAPSGFDEIRGGLIKEAAAFGKPVVVVHGDTHFYRVDKPFMVRRGSDPVVPNLTRVETFGDPFHHWVQIDIDADTASVFTFREQIVAGNAGKGR